MLDPFDNPETADASNIRGGRSGPDGGIGVKPTSKSSTPRVAYNRGVRVFAPGMPAPASTAPILLMGASSRQAPPAITRAALPARPGNACLAT